MGSASALSHGLHITYPLNMPPRIDGMGVGRDAGGWVLCFNYKNLVNYSILYA